MNARERQAIGKLFEAVTHLHEPDRGFVQTVEALGKLADTPFSAIFELPQGFPGEMKTINNDQPDNAAQEVPHYIHGYPAGPFLVENLTKSTLQCVRPMEVTGLSAWENTEYYFDFLRRYARKDQMLTFLRNSQGEVRWMLSFCHVRRHAFRQPLVDILNELSPHLGRAFENLSVWKTRWADIQAMNEAVQEPLAVLSFARDRNIPELAAASGGAIRLLNLHKSPSRRNVSFNDFLRLCSVARDAKGSPVRWRADDGQFYRLWAVKNANPDALLVRFEAENTAVSSLDSDQKAAVNAKLTPQQARVFAHLAKGLGNREIARDLSVSEFTVRAHIRDIFKRLNVSNRVEAINAVRNKRE